MDNPVVKVMASMPMGYYVIEKDEAIKLGDIVTLEFVDETRIKAVVCGSQFGGWLTHAF